VNTRTLIVLTGGPGGGKTTFIEELARDLVWRERFAALPEAISLMRGIGISWHERLFQRVMVHLQMALEDGLSRALGPDDPRLILCHRGSLDPLAYWLDRGWSEEEFFAFTETRREDHYRRYTAVIHLVTAADGAPATYERWPKAHRPEEIEDAIRLDRLLQKVWSGHAGYFRIDNEGRDWTAKSREARDILDSFLLTETSR
jgi:predicted ATPase